jgi:SAM-dependent methyltransferase
MSAGPEKAGPPALAGFDPVADGYDTTGTEFFSDLGRRLVAHAGIRAGDRVADLGCGAGAALIHAAIAAGPTGRVTGIDASEAMLARARQAVTDHGLTVALLTADAQDPKLPPGSLDVITASSMVQFLARPRRAVRTWLDLLAPGGRLALSWGMAQDPAWMTVMAALDDAVPRQSGPGFEEYVRRPPFNQPAALEHVLTEAGYAGAVTHAEKITTAYNSPEQWWQACLTQAPWVVSWKYIPESALPAVRDRALDLAWELRGTDGLIRRTLTFGCTIASRPA